MLKSLLSLFRHEGTEEKRIRLQGEIQEVNGKITRIEKGITMGADLAPLKEKRDALLKELNGLPLPKAEQEKSARAAP
ncbi:MAG: hypothetical protein WC767_02765 [Candidatus Paceibacterota bacterium]|jgi:hypothetical protein